MDVVNEWPLKTDYFFYRFANMRFSRGAAEELCSTYYHPLLVEVIALTSRQDLIAVSAVT